MNQHQLYKQSNHDFNTRPSKLSNLNQFNDPNRQKPNLLRINADNQDKKFMCIFWSLFLVFVITLAIVSKALPSAIKPISNQTQLSGTSLQGCQNPSVFQNDQLQCANFINQTTSIGIVAKQLSSLNQFVAFWLVIYPKDFTTPIIIDQNVTYLLYGLQNESQRDLKKRDIFENETVPFQYTSESTSYVYQDNSNTVKGYKVFIGFIGQFSADNLWLGLQFSGPFIQFTNISSIEIQGYKISKTFTGFTIAFRYVFFAISILAAFLYIRNYRKIPIVDRIIEQKLIGILSIFLIFFNDPFYPITVLKQNMASSFFSMLFVLGFIVYLIFLWVVFFDRILYEQGKKQTNQISRLKIGYMVLLFVLLMVLYMFYASYRLNNHPLVPTQRLNDRNILILDTLASICFGGVMLYIIMQYFRICCNKSDRLWRSELFMSYSILFIGAMIIFIFTDNALGSYDYNGTTVIFLYGLMNLYTWYLQYMYSPTRQTKQQINQKRSLHSDQIMSVGTVQFNDLNINLDQNQTYNKFGINNNKDNNNNKQVNSYNKQCYNKDKDVYLKDGQIDNNNRDDNFSIQDEDETNDPSTKQMKNRKKKDVKIDFFNENNLKQFNNSKNNNNTQNKMNNNRKQYQNQPIFKQQQNKNINQTNLLQLSSNPPNQLINKNINLLSTNPHQQIKHQDQSQLLYQEQYKNHRDNKQNMLYNNKLNQNELNQNELQIMSQMQSQEQQQNHNQLDYNNLQSENVINNDDQLEKQKFKQLNNQHIQSNNNNKKQVNNKNQGFGDFQLQ